MRKATAWIDETGTKGLVRNLTKEKDDSIALLVALVVDSGMVEEFGNSLREPFDAFKDSVPAGEKVHITDAFASQNDQWKNAAIKVRDEIRAIILLLKPTIVYGARRCREVRRSHEFSEQQKVSMIAETKERRPNYDFKNRPSGERIETEAFDHLVALLDCLGKDENLTISIRSDRIDGAIAGDCTRTIQEGMEVSASDVKTKIFNKDSKLVERNEYRLNMSVAGWGEDDLNITNINPNISIVSEVGPELLAVDILANDLAYHLKQNVSSSDRIYGSQATKDWWGASLIYGSNTNDLDLLEKI